MMIIRLAVGVISLAIGGFILIPRSDTHFDHNKDIVKGLSFVAPPKPFNDDPFQSIKKIEANYIAVIPYAFMREKQPTVFYSVEQKHWWGESIEGVIETIERAHANDIRVMLKPSVWMRIGWTGDLNFDQETDFQEWKTTHDEYVLRFAAIADSFDVALFCIANEFKQIAIARPEYWRALIEKIRAVYDGPLTYASNWDEYQQVTFWDDLDFIGINAYFPLSDRHSATKKELRSAWKPIEKDIARVAERFQKPVLFTEYGYLSADRATYRTWELEKQMKSLNINEALQARAFESLYEVFWNKPYWHGGFIWKWYPYHRSREEYGKRDYTPQGKESQELINSWFKRDNSK